MSLYFSRYRLALLSAGAGQHVWMGRFSGILDGQDGSESRDWMAVSQGTAPVDLHDLTKHTRNEYALFIFKLRSQFYVAE
jgi:hypothetical protein